MSINFLPKPIFNLMLWPLGCIFVLIPIYFYFGYEPLIIPRIEFSMLAHTVWQLAFLFIVCSFGWAKYSGKKQDSNFRWLSADLCLVVLYAAISVQLIDYAILFFAKQPSEHSVRIENIGYHSFNMGRGTHNKFIDFDLLDPKTNKHYIFSLNDNPLFSGHLMLSTKQLKIAIGQMGVLKGFHSQVGDVYFQLDLPEASASMPSPWTPWKRAEVVYHTAADAKISR